MCSKYRHHSRFSSYHDWKSYVIVSKKKKNFHCDLLKTTGPTNPYTGSLKATRVYASNKERVYGLVRPNPLNTNCGADFEYAKFSSSRLTDYFIEVLRNSNSTAWKEELSIKRNLLAVIPLFWLNSMVRFVVGSWSSEQVVCFALKPCLWGDSGIT